MDFQKLSDSFSSMTCILSIEKLPDGKFGNIRIVAGNKAYINSIEDTQNHMAASQMMSNKFIPDSPYENYVPKDLNFENQCYRCAVQKKLLHEYIKPDRYSFWLDVHMFPLEFDSTDKFYCAYSQEITRNADTEIMSNLSASTSAAVIETCIKLRSSGNFKNSIEEVVNDIRSICGAKMSCIVLTDEQNRQCSVLCQSSDPSVQIVPMEQHIASFGKDFYTVVDSWKKSIAGSSCLILSGESDMEILKSRDSVFYNSMQKAGVDSVVLFPLKYNNNLLGYIWAVNFDTSNTSKIKEILEITSYLLASEIANYQLLKKLEQMSSTDQLTGVYNRNAMINRISNFTAEDTASADYCVIYADLNGLKRINDRNGHQAGDILIIQAAFRLSQVFPECEIYRTGGDEFMILAAGIPHDVINERVNLLRTESEKTDSVSFSLGLSFGNDCEDIQEAIRTADAEMYEDKQNYYRKFPERKHR